MVQVMEKHGGILSSYLSKRRQSEKAAYCKIPTTWKGETMKTIQISVVTGRREKTHTGKAQRIFRAAKSSTRYHNEEYVSLHICPKPQVV